MTKQIGAGIIGMGRIGNRHAEEIIRHPGLNLIGFFDINPKAKGPKTYAYPSFNDFLNERDLEVVHVCTPNGTHFSIAKHCLSAIIEQASMTEFALSPLSPIPMKTMLSISGNHSLFL